MRLSSYRSDAPLTYEDVDRSLKWSLVSAVIQRIEWIFGSRRTTSLDMDGVSLSKESLRFVEQDQRR